MPINLRPQAIKPLNLTEETYRDLISRKTGGWSQCQDETEWLAKLHYLRSGLQEGKLDGTQFNDRETRLVVQWLQKMV